MGQKENHVPQSQTVRWEMVPNDLPMIETTGVRIAFMAKPIVMSVLISYRDEDLRLVLEILDQHRKSSMHILLAPDSFKESLCCQTSSRSLKGFQELHTRCNFEVSTLWRWWQEPWKPLAGVMDVTEYQTQVTIWPACFQLSYYQRMRWPFEMTSLVGLGLIQAKNEILLNWKHEELVALFCNWLTKGLKTICVGWRFCNE